MDTRAEWQAVEPLFDRALDLEPEERRRYIQSIQRESPGLARKLVQLLRAADGATEVIIDRSLGEVASDLVERVPQDRATGLQLGARVGNYELVELLGEGAAGKVYRARPVGDSHLNDGPDIGDADDVALKVLLSDDVSGAVVRRFEQEMAILSQLDHPGVAPALAVGRSEHGLRYVAMRLIDGPPIVEFVEHHALSVGEKVGLIVQVCAAVQVAHDEGIVHRDLKPSNILVEDLAATHATAAGAETTVRRPRPNPVVLDFGIARVGHRTGLTMRGQILGTPGYMSPEQARGESHTVTARSDVFSLGVLAYEIFEGRNPFARSSGVETLAAVIRENVPPLEGAPGLSAVVLKSLEKRPESRFSSVQGFSDALQESV